MRELTAAIVGLVWCQVAIFLTTVYLHRTLSHRALTMSAPLRFACRLLIWLTTGIQPRQWAAVHRKHHAYTDVEGDPHSPLIVGFATVQFGNAWLYRKVAMDPDTVARYAQGPPARPLGQGDIQARPARPGRRLRADHRGPGVEDGPGGLGRAHPRPTCCSTPR